MENLRFGPLTDRTVHLCVDMQNLFALETPWHTPWMVRVLSVVTRIAQEHPRKPYSRALFRPNGRTGCPGPGNGITNTGRT
jgi:hypothetical protein